LALSITFLRYGDLWLKNAHFSYYHGLVPPLFNPKFENVPLALNNADRNSAREEQKLFVKAG